MYKLSPACVRDTYGDLDKKLQMANEMTIKIDKLKIKETDGIIVSLKIDDVQHKPVKVYYIDLLMMNGSQFDLKYGKTIGIEYHSLRKTAARILGGIVDKIRNEN